MATGVGFGLAKMWLRRTIQGTEALEALGLPVFATINLAKAEKGVLQKHGEAGILAIANPADLAVEGLRSLRTSLQFGMLDAKSRSLAITSTAPGAGKSFTAANLAVVIAQAGQSVCLIDTDLRRGQLRKMFGVAKNQIGLSEYLTGERSLDEVIVQTGVEGLCFIPTGRYPPNPSELLLRKNMAELVAELDARFEMSIFDCPPVLAVTDPVIVGGVTGGLLAVVRYDKTPPAEVTAMTKILDSSGLKITGAILNGFDPRQAQAGGYSYNYNYRYEYKSRTKDAD
jgi:tyrosine-protein kinase Etk/Wzc